MARRKVVPQALHSELSEYASLLRSLRTTHTLDLATHLSQPQQSAPPSSERDSESDLGEDDQHVSDPDDAKHDVSSDPVSQGKRKRRSSGKRPRKTHDTWTRWPHMAGDVHAPEWTFEDEINVLAIHILKSRAPGTSTGPHENESPEANGIRAPDDDFADGSDSEEDTPLLPATLKALTTASSEYLAQILGALVAHVPPAAKQMQDRMRPMGWDTVLDVVGACKLVDENTLARVQRRMESWYGASESKAIPRLQAMDLSKNGFRDLVSLHDASIFTLPPVPKNKTKSKPSKKGTSSDTPTIDDVNEKAEDNNDEDVDEEDDDDGESSDEDEEDSPPAKRLRAG
ncbi:hypothetical protein PLICRDRAFT_28342 [Plicaturopsis crispa FD-325 SS-3]|nr:hypothetical protein PLICRDRAFT_28342 [Plicaturopsis crispa FD-325 SS-3]